MRINSKGFTLIELIVVMAVFITVLMITASSFDTILKQTSKLFRSEESNIEGIIGLEMMRHDLQQAGLGLFTESSPVAYLGEAASTPANSYNDYTSSVGTEPPRPIVGGNNLASGVTDTSGGVTYNFLPGTDYLAIKASTVGITNTSQKWSYIEFAAGGGSVSPHLWESAAENFTGGEKVVLFRRRVTSTTQTSTLIADTNGSASQSFYFSYGSSAFDQLAALSGGIYTIYGINGADLRMPFNRADYFVSRPSTNVPSVCAPGVGILYKATVNHSDGELNYIPLVDCVADMQVVLGWDMDGNGAIDAYSNADGSSCNGVCPASSLGLANQVQDALSPTNNSTSETVPNIRNSLKIIKVYILAQNGRRDPSYISPSPILVGDTGETALTRSYDINANNLQNYRWKLYRIVMRPKNLAANQ
ncbi:MAG TPA: PilW family protein [Deltaproteobacteria bacterium]|nr:PilW family protein [Deltaproteobacteria bacterium]HQB39163.1 PilW family protein [Deltaproteobacteria bacterium]